MQSMRASQVYKAFAVGIIAIAATVSGHVLAQSKVLADKAGMTVYTFDKDSPGKSACYGDCAAAWPPVAAGNMSGGADFSVISRDDGTRQVTYKGKPLYLFVGDKKPGDRTGDKLQNVWHVVAPAGRQVTSSANPAAYSTGSSSGY